jgi:hypothetical protein
MIHRQKIGDCTDIHGRTLELGSIVTVILKSATNDLNIFKQVATAGIDGNAISNEAVPSRI